MYLTYSEYIEYGGKSDESTFSQIEFDVEKKIDYYTNNRIKYLTRIPEDVKYLCYRLNIIMSTVEDVTPNGIISSYSNGIETFSYSRYDSKGRDVTETKISTLIKEYLSSYPDLIYRGRTQW